MIPYWTAQYLGAFVAAAVVLWSVCWYIQIKLETYLSANNRDFSTQGYSFMYSILSYSMTTDAINDYQINPLNCNVTIPNYEMLCTAGIFAT